MKKSSIHLLLAMMLIFLQSHMPSAQENTNQEYDCLTEGGRPLARYCIYTDGGRSTQEGLFNDPGICICRFHEQVYRIRVECLDRGFETWIWDGPPRAGDYIDTFGCNAIRTIAYTKAPPTKERVTGCVAEYCIPLPHVQRWGPVSEAKDWDFSLWGQNFCAQRAGEQHYNPGILAKLTGRLDPDTIIGFWKGLEFDHITQITKVGENHYQGVIVDPVRLVDFGFHRGELLISDLVYLENGNYEGLLKFRDKRGGHNWVNIHINLKDNNTFLADGKMSIRVHGDQMIDRTMGSFRISLNYPDRVIVDDPDKKDLIISWNTDLEFPITVNIATKPGWRPPYGGNFPPLSRTFDRALSKGGSKYVIWEDCVHCYGYRKSRAATFTMEFVVMVTDRTGRKSAPADEKVVCVVNK